MRERDRGIIRMIVGGLLCVAAVSLAMSATKHHVQSICLAVLGAAVMLTGAVLSGCGTIADAIRDTASEPSDDEVGGPG